MFSESESVLGGYIMNVSKKLLLSLFLGASITASSLSGIPLTVQTNDHHMHQVNVSATGVVTWADGPNIGLPVRAEYILRQVRAQLATITATVEPRVTAVETEIREVINPHLAALDHRMDTFEGRIGILAEQNQTLQAATKGFDGQIRGLDGKILDLANRVTIVEQTLVSQARALEQEHNTLADLQQQVAAKIEVEHVGQVTEALGQAVPAATPEQLADLQRQITAQGDAIREQAQQMDTQARFTQEQEARIRTMKKVLIIGGFVLGLTAVGGGIGFIVLGTKVAALTKTVGFLGVAVEALKTTVGHHTGLILDLGTKINSLTGTVTNGLRDLHQFFTSLGGRVTTLETGMGTLQTTVSTLTPALPTPTITPTLPAPTVESRIGSFFLNLFSFGR